MAVNTADAKLWVKHSDGTLKSISNVGSQGSQGAPSLGPQGYTGLQGSLGVQGPTGFVGPQGSQGGVGSQGSQGSVGSQGNQGATGPGGIQGFQGPQSVVSGFQGVQGTIGPQGPTGPTGLQGADNPTYGPTGPQGPTGFQGPQGLGGPDASSTGGGEGPGTCFLGSSYTIMADGSRKMMKDVKVGDLLMGAFGESNEVLASEDLILGDRPMFVINYTHHTSGDHPHVTPDRKFVAIEPHEAFKEWGQWYNCELADGSVVMLNNVGFDNPEDKVKEMEIGNVLQTIEGPKSVDCIESYYLPPETKLYNFVMSGSHTYFADGYAVTGWPRDDDFDYVEWKQIGETSKIEDWLKNNNKVVN
jgi:hypothetical protein